MGRKPMSYVAAVTLGLACIPGVAASAQDAKRGCAATGRTVAADGKVRVYRVGPRKETEVFACWLATGRRHLLYEDPPLGAGVVSPSTFAVAGGQVAVGEQVCDVACSATVALVDGRTAKTIRSTRRALTGAVVALDVKRDGTILYGLANGTAPAADQSIGLLSPTRDEALAAGADVDPRSIALGRDNAFWMQGGSAAQATL